MSHANFGMFRETGLHLPALGERTGTEIVAAAGRSARARGPTARVRRNRQLPPHYWWTTGHGDVLRRRAHRDYRPGELHLPRWCAFGLAVRERDPDHQRRGQPLSCSRAAHLRPTRLRDAGAHDPAAKAAARIGNRRLRAAAARRRWLHPRCPGPGHSRSLLRGWQPRARRRQRARHCPSLGPRQRGNLGHGPGLSSSDP